ncbi:MAG TPA: hypothetical protein VGC80_05225 [Acetobacteraceae bacterium]
MPRTRPILAALLGLALPMAASAQPKPDVADRCDANKSTSGCTKAVPGANSDTGAARPGSGPMLTSPTGMMTDSAAQPPPHSPKPPAKP